MRTSKQKELILKVINNNYSHCTALEIYELCQKEIANISLGTVYRNLNTLTDNGEILRIKMPDNVDRYDHIFTKHSHFICIKCNKIYDVNKSLDNPNIDGFKVIDYEIIYKGICKNCLEKKGKDYGIKRK